MPRIARIVIPNVPHHITQRGNQRQDVFFTLQDRILYLKLLTDYSNRYDLKILGYCLMSNHVHVVAIPMKSDSMARTLNVAHMRYAQYIFRNNGGSGHLWQGRFFSTALDEKHLWYCLRYIEQNPVKIGIVFNEEDYMWSSASCHCGLRDDNVLTSRTGYDVEIDGWRETLRESLDDKVVEMIKRRTHSGLPCGDDRFLKRMSRKMQCEFVERERGRPRKDVDKTP